MNIQYNSMLKLEHFEDPSFRSLVREVFPYYADGVPDFPRNREGAKDWEITNCVRAMRDFGVLNESSEILGVAAGFEHTVFWLTRYVKRVFSTDLYQTNEQWREAASGMLFDPTQFANKGFSWNPRRLVVQYMNALDLRYEDHSFEGVFSCGSIEHFGSLDNVATAMKEIGRVLKPGGTATVVTEFRIDGPDGDGVPGIILFTPEMLMQYVVAPSGLTLVDEPDWNTSQATIDSAYPLAEAVEFGVRPRSIALSQAGYRWTSGLVCLRKPG